MGQQQNSSKGENIQTFAIKGLDSHIVSSTLQKQLKQMNSRKVSNREVMLFLPDQIDDSKMLKFMCEDPIEDFKNYCGFGKIYNYAGKKIFEGEFTDGRRNGFGVQYDTDMTPVYQGYFKDNAHEGWGVTTSYEGEFINGKKCGWGKYTVEGPRESQNMFYEGYWQNDHCHGTGFLNVKSQEVDDFLKQNFHVELEPFKYKYVGQWRMGEFSGIGKLVKKNQIYSGQFIHGLYEGMGTLSANGGAPVKGEFLQGKLIS